LNSRKFNKYFVSVSFSLNGISESKNCTYLLLVEFSRHEER